MADANRFQAAMAAFDQANHADPKTIIINGASRAGEVVYAERMTEMLTAFLPQASEHLQLAARSQHIERWILPRDSYPMDRKGYLQWRADLKLHHAKRATELMLAAGYELSDCERVASLLKKEKMKSDDESQALEDVVCLVFLKYYFTEFGASHSEEKIIDILQKTWRKMSDKGHEAALALPFSDENKAIILKALS